MDIGSVNGMVPYKHQAITWTDADPDVWQLMASLDHNNLTLQGLALLTLS